VCWSQLGNQLAERERRIYVGGDEVKGKGLKKETTGDHYSADWVPEETGAHIQLKEEDLGDVTDYRGTPAGKKQLGLP